MTSNAKKSQFQARLENQKAQLERHGNFAEVVIRTTPEGTDMLNFARLWEHVLVVADRQTRGYIAKNSRVNFDKTREDFNESVRIMLEKMKECIERHEIDLTSNNFISRVAQRYELAERKKGAEKSEEVEEVPAKKAKPKAEEVEAAPAEEAPKAAPKKEKTEEQVDGF